MSRPVRLLNPRLPATENEGRIIRGSTLFAARDHLGDPFHGCHFICDYNGITVPDWGLSELVFGKKLHRDGHDRLLQFQSFVTGTLPAPDRGVPLWDRPLPTLLINDLYEPASDCLNEIL